MFETEGYDAQFRLAEVLQGCVRRGSAKSV